MEEGRGDVYFPPYSLIPVMTMPLTKYCWAAKKMQMTGTTAVMLAAMT